MGRITVGVGTVVFRGESILLIKRGKAPFKGRWSIPGGRLEYDEALEAAALRELREESGVEATILGLIGVFEALPSVALREEAGGNGHLVMVDYAAEWRSGEPVAGDDASAAEFFAIDEAMALVAWDETRRALRMAISRRLAGSG